MLSIFQVGRKVTVTETRIEKRARSGRLSREDQETSETDDRPLKPILKSPAQRVASPKKGIKFADDTVGG
jgi:hypothetical protein